MMLTCFFGPSRLCFNEILLRSVCQIAHIFSLGCQRCPPWMGELARLCPLLRVLSNHKKRLLHAQHCTRKPVSFSARHAYAFEHGNTSQLPRITPLLCRFSSQSTCWNDAMGTAHDSALHPVHVPPEPRLHIHNSACFGLCRQGSLYHCPSAQFSLAGHASCDCFAKLDVRSSGGQYDCQEGGQAEPRTVGIERGQSTHGCFVPITEVGPSGCSTWCAPRGGG